MLRANRKHVFLTNYDDTTYYVNIAYRDAGTTDAIILSMIQLLHIQLLRMLCCVAMVQCYYHDTTSTDAVTLSDCMSHGCVQNCVIPLKCILVIVQIRQTMVCLQ